MRRAPQDSVLAGLRAFTVGLLVLATTFLCGSGRGGATEPVIEAPGPHWPSDPVAVSPVEAVIEAFWIPRLEAPKRWRGDGGVLTAYWDACFFKFLTGTKRRSASLSRRYDLDLGGFKRLRVRLRPGRGVTTRIVATVDGRATMVAEHVAETNDALEIVGPVKGKRLNGLRLEFAVSADAEGLPPENEASSAEMTHAVQLRWVLLEKDGNAWTSPEAPFEGMIARGPLASFSPGLGLLFGNEELARLRDVVASPLFADVWRADVEFAARQQDVDPAALIRPYSLYAHTRYGRDTDVRYETVHDGLILALVGLITRSDDLLRQAARHAVALARVEHWAEGFVDRVPGYRWYHSGFAPNVATIKAALLLDWTWHALTPAGRGLLRDAIREKGLPFVERARDAMANQGVRFAKGMILGRMALAESFEEPELRAYVRAAIERINAKLVAVVRPDGTFSEAMDYYGKGTMATTVVSYHAASRALAVPIVDLVTPRMLPAMRYILEADGRLNAPMAAFCAGPLGDSAFSSQIVPTGMLHNFVDADLPAGSHEGNRIEYVFFGLQALWAPRVQATVTPPSLPRFAVYPAGGWVFAGSDDPDLPRLSFESGVWDGQGHSWFHKNALTLNAGGERLLVSRMHLPYSDARSQYTMQTKLYNTFAPSGRNQDASGTQGRGARLTVAEDLGEVVVLESDNATAWKSGVERAVRRVVFVRPDVLLVDDSATFAADEPGVQSWNSYRPWRRLGARACESRVGDIRVRLSAVAQQPPTLTTGQDSVGRTRGGEVPVYRAAFTTPSAREHRVRTLIEVQRGVAGELSNVRARPRDGIVDVRSAESRVILFAVEDAASVLSGHGCRSDGALLLVIERRGRPAVAMAFDATWLETPDGQTATAGATGNARGLIVWRATDGSGEPQRRTR